MCLCTVSCVLSTGSASRTPIAKRKHDSRTTWTLLVCQVVTATCLCHCPLTHHWHWCPQRKLDKKEDSHWEPELIALVHLVSELILCLSNLTLYFDLLTVFCVAIDVISQKNYPRDNVQISVKTSRSATCTREAHFDAQIVRSNTQRPRG